MGENDTNNDPYKILIRYKNSKGLGLDPTTHLSDRGIIPYKDGNFNKVNSITLEPIYHNEK